MAIQPKFGTCPIRSLWTFMLDSDAQAGTLKISEENGPVPVLQSKILPGESFSTVLKQNSKLTISWENENGNTYSTEIVDIPTRNESAIASDPIIVSSSSKGTISDQLAELQFISQPDLTWTFSAMNAKDRSGEFGESLSQNEFASLYGGRLGEISIEKVSCKLPISRQRRKQWNNIPFRLG